MSKFLNPKELIFYGVAISAVVTLFSLVSTYGEKNLKASRQIDGRYTLIAQELPGCLQSKSLILQIQQSGKYLTGTLLPTDATENRIRIGEEHPSLSGQWQQPELTLAGTTHSIPDCKDTLSIQAQITQPSMSNPSGSNPPTPNPSGSNPPAPNPSGSNPSESNPSVPNPPAPNPPISGQPTSGMGQPTSGTIIYGNNIISGTVTPSGKVSREEDRSQPQGSQEILTGMLRLGSSNAIPFSAKRETPSNKTPEH